jgi:hypothetical protein
MALVAGGFDHRCPLKKMAEKQKSVDICRQTGNVSCTPFSGFADGANSQWLVVILQGQKERNIHCC